MATPTKTQDSTVRNAFGKIENINQVITLDTVSDIYFAFDHFYPEGTIYKFDTPYSKGNFYWNNRQEFKEYVFKVTGLDIRDGSDRKVVKLAQARFFDIAEGKTEVKMEGAEGSPVSKTSLNKEESEILREKAQEYDEQLKATEQNAKKVIDEAIKQKQVLAQAQADAKAKADAQIKKVAAPEPPVTLPDQTSPEKIHQLLNNLEGKSVWVKPIDELPKRVLSPQEKKTLIANSHLTQKQIFDGIRNSIPVTERDRFPEYVITNAATKIHEGGQIVSSYDSEADVPQEYLTPFVASPYTAFLNPKNEVLAKIFPDAEMRGEISKAAQPTLLALSQEHDMEREAASYLLQSENLIDVYLGANEVTAFEPSIERQEGGIEIEAGDIKNLIQKGQEINSFISQNTKLVTGEIEIPSTGFSPLRVPESQLPTLSTPTPTNKHLFVGGIEGQKTQGDLARMIARERARRAALKPIELGITVADGTAPISFQIEGAGATTNSLFSVMTKSEVPILLTSIAVGGYAAADIAGLTSYVNTFGGKPILYMGVGKFNFSVVNAGNMTIGGAPLSRFTSGFQLGSKSFNLEITKKAGKVISSAFIKTSEGVATRTVLPSIITKVIGVVAGLGSWATLGLSLVGGWLLDKAIKKIPWRKIRDVVIAIPAAIAGFILFGAPGAAIFGLGGFGVSRILTGGLPSLQSGLTSVTSGMGSAFRFAFITALSGIVPYLIGTIIGLPLLIAFILFIINSGAYVVPPNPAFFAQSQQNPYIDVVKTANPAGPFNNSDLPLKITYTITVTAKKSELIGVTVKHECTVYQKSGKQACQAPPIVVPDGTIKVGSPFVFTYDAIYNTTYTDSLVINTVEVTANIPNDPNSQTATGAASITIGTPPSACLKLDNTWANGSTYKSNMEAAIAIISGEYSTYLGKVCSSYPEIRLTYNPAGYGNFYGWNHGTYIDFFPIGVDSPNDALYTLAHELGHSLAWGASTSFIYDTYRNTAGIRSEAPYCFYSATKNWDEGESMPEAIALYILNTSKGTCGSVQTSWPIHYRFIMKYVFN